MRSDPRCACRHAGEIRDTLAKYGVVEAGVFGSVARGDDVPGSDLEFTSVTNNALETYRVLLEFDARQQIHDAPMR